MKKLLSGLSGIMLAFCLLLPPCAVTAQGVQIPDDLAGVIPESDLVELIGYMAQYRSADLFAHLQAVDAVLTPLFADIKSVLGSDVDLPDVSAITNEFEAKIDAIFQSSTASEAESRVQDLISSGQEVQARFQEVASKMQAVASQLEQKGARLQEELTAAMDEWLADEEQKIQQQLDEENRQLTAEMQAEVEQYAADLTQSLIAAAGNNPNPDAIKAQVDAAVAAKVAQESRELQQYMQQRGEELSQQLQAAAEVKADELSAGAYSALESIRDTSGNINERIEQAAQALLPSYDIYYQKFLQKKAAIIQAAVDAQLETARQQIRAFADELDEARKQGRDVPSADELLSRLEGDKQALIDRIVMAESGAAIDEAVNEFKARWDNIRKSLEAARMQGAQEIIDKTLAALNDKDTETKLLAAQVQIEKGIKDLEAGLAQNGLKDTEKAQLMKLYQLLPLVEDCLSLINEFKQANADDDIDYLLTLKDRLQERLTGIQRCTDEESLCPGLGTFIEAENESSRDLLPPTEEWHSHQELDATWRPEPLSSNGAWYLSRGGESLSYSFSVKTEGDYVLWVRDLGTSEKSGQRAISIAIDGVDYGTFTENPNPAPEPGIFGWHKTATIHLSAGTHTLTVTKAETTGGAAILDCFYLTNNPDEVPTG
jgi:archaellum component FlaG (FlaF/FlaG flagellin family)